LLIFAEWLQNQFINTYFCAIKRQIKTMKHLRLFYFLVLCLPFAAFSQQKINEITANIEGVANATTKIVGTFGDQNYIADTAIIYTVQRAANGLVHGFVAWQFEFPIFGWQRN
jgi:hypothetical protein